MSIDYKINYSEVEKLQGKLEKIPGNVEDLINQYLRKEGSLTTIEYITNLIRVSRPSKGAVEHTPHAKKSKWSKVEKLNLGFVVKTKGGAANKPGSFGYLVFPNEGRGPRNPLEQRFMERGLQRSVPDILLDLNQLIEEEMRKGLE